MFLLVSPACRKDAGDPVATLIKSEKQVDRQASRDREWSPAERGTEFFFENGLRTGPASQAVLRLARGGELRVDENTSVHFQRKNVGGQTGAIFDIQTGAIELEAQGQAMPFDLAFGSVMLEPSGKVRLEREAAGTRLSVLFGHLSMDAKEGRLTVAAGQNVVVDFGGVLIDEQPAPPTKTAAQTSLKETAPTTPEEPGLVAIEITGKKAQLRSGDKWRALPAGASAVPAESVIRLGKKTRLTLGQGDNQAFVDGLAEVIVAPPGGELLHAQSGTVTLAPRTANLSVSLPGGLIEGRPSKRGATVIEIDSRGKGAISVQGGVAAIRSQGNEEVLESSGAAMLMPDGKLIIIHRIPSRADVTIGMGESPTIHDGKPPTAVRVRAACGGDGMLEVTEGARSLAEPSMLSPLLAGGANVLLAAGPWRYRVVCDGKELGQGRILVTRDNARKMLPQRPASTTIEADGRPYLVLYQNHLPALTFTWRKASPGAYTFHYRELGGATRSFPVPSAQKTFRSGEIPEGTYEWVFEGGGQRSSPSKLTIEFDNAASTAYLSAPVQQGSAREVQGAAILGSKVTAQGVALELDRHQRFRADMGDKDVLPIRIVHPRQGIHYYVVRASH